MAQSNNISLLTTDAATERAVSSALGSHARLSVGTRCEDYRALTGWLAHNPASLALVDIDADPDRMLDELETIVGDHAETRFVVLCSHLDAELVLRAMQAGARHVQVKGKIETEFADVLVKLLPERKEQPKRQGRVVTVLSAGGGCGATTLVVNLANETRLKTESPTLVIDLDTHYGAVGSYLEVEGRYGIADVTAQTDRIDAEMINSTALPYTDNFDVLLSPATVDYLAPLPIHYERLEVALAAASGAYEYVFVDAPRLPMDLAADLVRASDETILLLQMTVKDLRVARSMLSALVRRGVSLDRIKPIVNRFRRQNQMITLKEAEKALGGKSLMSLSNDYPSAIRSVNYGELLAHSASRSPLRKELVRLAADVAKPHTNGNGAKAA